MSVGDAAAPLMVPITAGDLEDALPLYRRPWLWGAVGLAAATIAGGVVWAWSNRPQAPAGDFGAQPLPGAP